jgi:uncharacterized membrane protein YphA (DoxX/SURF4 family)
VVVGVTIVLEGSAYFIDWRHLRFEVYVAGSLAFIGGVCLLCGLLTPVAGILIALVSTAVTLSWLPVPAGNLFGNHFAALYVVAMAMAVVLLGPGAFSLDARLFGRREIAIPRTSRSPVK